MADLNARTIIKASMRLIGAIAVGETPSADEENHAFEALRIMLRQWSSRGAMIFVQTRDTHVLSQGTASYTIGSGATINTARPVQIVGAYVNSGGIDHPVRIVGPGDYRSLSQKTIGYSYPDLLYYSPGYSQGTIYVWPPGGGTLYMDSLKPLSDPTTLTADMTIPVEYQAAIKWNLACELAPEYGIEPSLYIVSKAEEAKGDIIRINAILAQSEVKPEILQLVQTYHIDEG